MVNSKNKIFLITISALFISAILLFVIFSTVKVDEYKKYKLAIIGINPFLFTIFFYVLNYKNVVFQKMFVLNNDEKKYQLSSFGLLWIIIFCLFVTALQFLSFIISFKGIEYQVMFKKIFLTSLMILLFNFLCSSIFIKLNTYYLNKI